MTRNCVAFNIFKMNQIVKADENHAAGNLLFIRPLNNLTFYCIMFQNGQTYFKNQAINDERFSVSGHLGTLSIKES